MSMPPQHTTSWDDHLFDISFPKSKVEELCDLSLKEFDEFFKQFDFAADFDEKLKSLEPLQKEKVDHSTMQKVVDDRDSFLKAEVQSHLPVIDDIDDFVEDLDEYVNSLEEPSPNEKVDHSTTEKVDHCTKTKVVDETLINAKDELSKDSVVWRNEVSSPVSIDHCTTEKVVDIALDVSPSTLNNVRLPINKKSGRWSKEEQRLFLVGLERYGNGRWKDISEHFVLTRTKEQVASHAQKYIIRQNALKEKKKRKSIHDTLLPKIDQRNCDFTPGSATLQPLDKVQQLSYNIPHQMRGVEYLDVDPHYIQQQNLVSFPIQPYPRKVYDISSLFSPNLMSF